MNLSGVWRRRANSFGMALLAWFFLWDATTSVLIPQDAATGRVMGCYTALELAVGVTKPSIIRLLELVGGVLLAISSVYVLVRRRQESSGRA